MMEPLVSKEWLKEHLNDSNLVILDASLESNIVNQISNIPPLKIKGALAFNMKTTFFDKESVIPNMIPSPKLFTEECQNLGINDDSIIIVYDNLGIYWSPRVRWMFKVMGHNNIAVLDGGLIDWYESDFDCEKIDVNNIVSKIGNFHSQYRKELVVSSSEILKNIEEQNLQIFDARSAERFFGKIPEPRPNMESGHIPRSTNLPYKLVLNGNQYHSKSKLKEIIKTLDIENDKLGFSCGSGITACIIMLAFELIGSRDTRLYDGSWSEWGVLGKFPIEV